MSSLVPLPEPPTKRSGATGAPISVVLADDHDSTRRNLRALLDAEADIEVVAEASDLFTSIRHVVSYAPRVLLLDLRMPGGSSWDVIRLLRAQAPHTAVVVVTMEEGAAYAQKAIDLGAVGYVLKDTAVSDLPQAIRCAARGERFVSTRSAQRRQGQPISGPRAA